MSRNLVIDLLSDFPFFLLFPRSFLPGHAINGRDARGRQVNALFLPNLQFLLTLRSNSRGIHPPGTPTTCRPNVDFFSPLQSTSLRPLLIHLGTFSPHHHHYLNTFLILSWNPFYLPSAHTSSLITHLRSRNFRLSTSSVKHIPRFDFPAFTPLHHRATLSDLPHRRLIPYTTHSPFHSARPPKSHSSLPAVPQAFASLSVFSPYIFFKIPFISYFMIMTAYYPPQLLQHLAVLRSPLCPDPNTPASLLPGPLAATHFTPPPRLSSMDLTTLDHKVSKAPDNPVVPLIPLHFAMFASFISSFFASFPIDLPHFTPTLGP